MYTNPLNVSETICKLKLMSYWPFFQIVITTEVICKQNYYMNTRLANIFKIVNVMTFVKDILESPYKDLIYEGPYIFHRTFSFSNFWRLNCYYFGIILNKSIKVHFLEIIH